MTDVFDKYMGRLLSAEGGLSLDNKDPGNWTGGLVGVGKLVGTKYGIAANTYPTLDITNLTKQQAILIYRKDFWERYHVDVMPGAVAYSVLDGLVNSGPVNAIRWLQQACGVADDGHWGPQTGAAVASMDPCDLLLKYNSKRLLFMTKLSTWQTYGKGWASRIAQNLLYGAEDN